MKKCKICNIEKPLSDFYKHKNCADGYLHQCIECKKNGVKERLSFLRNNIDWVEKERARGREKNVRLYRTSAKPYKPFNFTGKTWKQNYPEKANACRATQHIKTLNQNNELHHWSYHKQHLKDVIEMSDFDHKKLHTFLIYDQEFFMYRGLNNILLDTKEKHIEYIINLGFKIY